MTDPLNYQTSLPNAEFLVTCFCYKDVCFYLHVEQLCIASTASPAENHPVCGIVSHGSIRTAYLDVRVAPAEELHNDNRKSAYAYIR